MYKRVNKLLGTKYKSDSDIDWWSISKDRKLSESFIREFQDYVDWDIISRKQILSESFIREFEDKVSWKGISNCQTLSESFIEKFQDKIFWSGISANQTLSENLIRKFINKIDWIYLVFSQLLSWKFILEFEDRVDWDYVSKYQPFINPNYKKIQRNLLKYNLLYCLYQETKNRKWFIGYVKEKNKNFSLNPNTYDIKSKIYWKDLVMLNKTKSFEPIRRVKYV